MDPAQISRRHLLLFKKVFDLTFVLTQRLSTIAKRRGQVFLIQSMTPWTWPLFGTLNVQSVGNFIIEYRFLEELDDFCKSNSNFFLLAFPPTPQVDEGGGRARSSILE